MKKPWLSTSALSIFRDCPRCFWQDKNAKVPRPRGIMSSLPNGLDLLIKDYHDAHRLAGTLPPELKGKIPGKLYPDIIKLTKMRHWKTGLSADLGFAIIGGALDDLLMEVFYSPYDYKTKGSSPGEGYAEKYYEPQGDHYSLLFKENNMPPSGKAVFAFYSPLSIQGLNEVSVSIPFEVKVVIIESSAERGRELVAKAAECLAGSLPPPSEKCEYCALIKIRNNVDESPAGLLEEIPI